MSPQSRLPPGVLGDAPHRGLPRGQAEKTKGQWGRCSRLGYPPVTTLAEEIQEAKLRTRASARTAGGCCQAGLKEWKGQGGGVRVLGPAGVSWGDGEVAVGPVGFLTPKRAQEAAKWQFRERACQTLSSPGYGAAPQQTPDGKGRRNKSALLGRHSPSAAPRQPPTSGSSFSKCRNFSQALNPASHGHGGSPADVATPGSWRCT